MMSGSQDATNARTAHHAVERILICGLIRTVIGGSVAQNCNFLSNVRQIQETKPTTSTNNIINFYMKAGAIKKKTKSLKF